MAVYTKITETQLRDFLSTFSCGDLVNFYGITTGVENTNYCVKTTQDTFILTLFEKRVQQEDIPFFLQVMDHMYKKGIVCPKVIANKGGEILHTLCCKKAVLISFLKGDYIRHMPSQQTCYQVGKMLAKMHLSVTDFPFERQNTLNLDGWKNLFNKIQTQMHPSHRTLVEQELVFQERHQPKHLPRGVVHADLFRENVFFTDGHISGIIDFYFSCMEHFIYDVAITMTDWCFTPLRCLDIDKTKAFLEGYQVLRPLMPEERYALLPCARGASLRFYLTRYFDYLNTSSGAQVVVKDPQEYEKKLHFYQTFCFEKAGIL